MNKVVMHGEVVVSNVLKIPKGAQKLTPKDGRYIVADSETTGNHHCIEAKDGVEMYELNGILYLKNEEPAKLFCVDEKRHDTKVLSPGISMFERANEYDFLQEMTKKVAD